MHLLRSVPLVLLLAPTLVACDRAPSRFETELRGPIMGTTFSVKVVTAERLEPARRDEIEDRVVAALEGVNATMSTWLDDSELSRFNGATTTEPIPLSPDTLEVIAEALEIGSASGGALDVTVGPLVDLWGFGPAPPPESLPSLETIDEMRSHTGLELLEVSLEHGWARKQDAALEVDLSSIAKGYAVDRAAERLEAEGITDYMVEVGGEIRVAGRNRDGGPWRLAVERPLPGAARTLYRVIAVTDTALATSGDYRNRLEIEGQVVSHTLDPRTGRPIVHDLASVSVLAERCSTADGWATALNVLGPSEGWNLAEELGLAALFLTYTEDGDVAPRATSAWTSATGGNG